MTVLASLIELARQQKLPSPLIIEGAERADWAQSLVAQELCETHSACNKCSGCKKVQNRFHPDWIQLPEDFKLEDIREALRLLRLRPFEANHRVLVVPDLQSTQVQIQNSLLKTLEEPSEKWILILPVASRWNLLETLRSRCLFVTTGTGEVAELTEADQIIFDLIGRADDLHLHPLLEPAFKDRKKAIDLWTRLLEKASSESYPNHWLSIAPLLEDGVNDLKRNLNPKTVWDRVWIQSLPS